jgi:hypothetical protein
VNSLQDFDFLQTKLNNLEKEVIDLHERYLTVAETIREMQKYMVKMAQHQAILAQQFSHWPYIEVEKRPSNKVNRNKE